MIKDAINNLILGCDLSQTDTKEVFDEILSGLSDDILTSSFATALKIKGETVEEISSAISISCESIKKYSCILSDTMQIVPFLDNDNYIDIAFGVDIVLSACGIGVFKYCLDSYFDFNKSFLTLKNAGVSNFSYNENLFEKTNFAYFQLDSALNYIKYTKNVSNKMCFKNIFSITDKLLNPLHSKNIFIGLNDKDLVEKYANICLKLNMDNSLVLSGNNGFSFASIDGDTYVAEAWKNKIFTYVINPELVGLKKASFDDISCENSEHSLSLIKGVFDNKIKTAPYDIIVLNSALALYISKKAESIMDGILLAKKIIDEGLAKDKLSQICQIYS